MRGGLSLQIRELLGGGCWAGLCRVCRLVWGLQIPQFFCGVLQPIISAIFSSWASTRGPLASVPPKENTTLAFQANPEFISHFPQYRRAKESAHN